MLQKTITSIDLKISLQKEKEILTLKIFTDIMLQQYYFLCFFTLYYINKHDTKEFLITCYILM